MRHFLLIFIAIFPMFAMGQQNAKQSFDAILSELSEADYDTRTKAQEKLQGFAAKHPQVASKLLFKNHKKHADPEVRERCYGALEQLYLEKFAPPKRGYLGVRHKPAQAQFDGKPVNAASIQTVVKNSPADKAGIKEGDLIIAAGGENFTKVPAQDLSEAFSSAIKKNPAGSEIDVTLLRNGKKMKLNATLEAYEDKFSFGNRDTEKLFQDWLESLE